MSALVLGVLASGSGTNFDSIADAVADGRVPARIAVLVCNRPNAAVMGKASARDIPTRLIDHRDFASREDFDDAVADELEKSGVEAVVMAGFDRVVTGRLLSRFPDRVVNIHPALLPSFRGTHAQAQAAEYGVTIAGATVHFVDESVDHGPIIAQGAVPVRAGEDAETVRRRILALEHRLYPHALRLLALGRIRVEGRHVLVEGHSEVENTCLVSPPFDED